MYNFYKNDFKSKTSNIQMLISLGCLGISPNTVVSHVCTHGIYNSYGTKILTNLCDTYSNFVKQTLIWPYSVLNKMRIEESFFMPGCKNTILNPNMSSGDAIGDGIFHCAGTGPVFWHRYWHTLEPMLGQTYNRSICHICLSRHSRVASCCIIYQACVWVGLEWYFNAPHL